MCKTLKKEDEKDSVAFLMEQTETVPWPKLEWNYISHQCFQLPTAPYPRQVAPMGLSLQAILTLPAVGAAWLLGQDFPVWAVTGIACGA